MNVRVGSHRPNMLFFGFLLLIFHDNLETIRQGNADLCHKMWMVAHDWTNDLLSFGEPLTTSPPHLWQECAHWVWFFFNFLLSAAVNLNMFLVKLLVKWKLIYYREFQFDASTKTSFFLMKSSGTVTPNEHSAGSNLKKFS